MAYHSGRPADARPSDGARREDMAGLDACRAWACWASTARRSSSRFVICKRVRRCYLDWFPRGGAARRDLGTTMKAGAVGISLCRVRTGITAEKPVDRRGDGTGARTASAAV